MAKKKAKSNVMAKLKKRAKGSWKMARGAEGKAKGSMLPGGIVRGVAHLSSYKIDEDKKGNPYVFLTGTVQEPEEFKGLRATSQHFIRPTENKTVEDKLEELVSDLKLLGAEGVEESDIDDLPQIVADLVKVGPYYFFNTWAPDDSRGAFVFIQGLAEDYQPDEDAPEDDTEDDDSEDDPDDSEPEDDEPGDDDSEDDEPSDDSQDDDWEPLVEDVYLYKATSRSKPKEVEVKTVNKRKRTVTVVREEDGKTFKDVPWDKLEGAED